MCQLAERFARSQFITHAVQGAGDHTISDSAALKGSVLMGALVLYCIVLTTGSADEDVNSRDVHTAAGVFSEFFGANGTVVLQSHGVMNGFLSG